IVATFPGSVGIQGVLESTDEVMVPEKEDVMKPIRMGTRPDTCIFDPSPLSLLPCSITGSQLTADPSCRAPSAGGRTWLRVTAARRAPVSPGGGPAPVLSDDEQEAPKAALAFYIPGRPALRDADPPGQELTSWRLEVMVPSPPLLNLPLRLRRLGCKHLSRLAGYFSYFVIS
ncbi:hypothetical protein GOODEAATRI_024280, partial [Goodea atripinnis]